jgi:hypothetical protein
MKKVSVFLLIGISFLSSCSKDDNANTENGEYKGAEVTVHLGKAWSVVKVDDEGNPTELTVRINDAALASVPVGSGGGAGSHNHENSVVLPFHDKAKALTPFKHIGLDYNPDGHEPAAVYGLPHFDIHFYLMTEAERMAIPPYEVDSSKFLKIPTQAYVPANYMALPGGVPQMGTHWVDVTSPELAGQTFTQTFIYGSYNSNVTFYEPMVTLKFLQTTSQFSRDIPQPSKVQVSGHYPTKMEIRKHDGITDVTLTAFVYRQAQ